MADRDPGGPVSGDAATIEPIGDAALLISFGQPGRIEPAAFADLAARAQAVAASIDGQRAALPAIGRPVAALASVLVPFDPLAIVLDEAVELARSALASSSGRTASSRKPDRPAPPTLEIPVRYGGSDGPDLEAVAELHGLRPAEVIDLHASATYRVLFLGFAPGFGYLGGLPTRLATPRRDSPRERVPAGSVGIAGDQTAVYPFAMPGGWRLIGRTSTVLFDPGRAEPALLRPGATVRFVPVPR